MLLFFFFFPPIDVINNSHASDGYGTAAVLSSWVIGSVRTEPMHDNGMQDALWWMWRLVVKIREFEQLLKVN